MLEFEKQQADKLKDSQTIQTLTSAISSILLQLVQVVKIFPCRLIKFKSGKR